MKNKVMNYLTTHLANFFSGAFFAFVGYFTPVASIIHLMIVIIVVDLILGVIAARYRGEGISSIKLWRTVYKLCFSLMLVMMVYAVDIEMGLVDMHKIIAWGIAGFELWSILESMGSISNHKMFRIIQNYMSDQVKEKTGIDVNGKKE